MTSLITGGAGFIGSHLAEELVHRGEEVLVVDDLSTGSIENVEQLKEYANFTYAIDTIQNRHLMAELVDRADVIFHLAAAVGVRLIIESPVKTIETNIEGTRLMLELAAKKKKKVVVASTSEVYGKANTVPFSEGDDLVFGPTAKGRWSYACSKVIDEFLALAYWKEKRVPVVIARLFNVIGPRQTGRYGMVVPSFIIQALTNRAITVFGDGMQSRSFTWVGDAVRALVGLAHHPDAVGQVFNVGSPNEVRIMELARMVKELTQSRSEIVLVPYDAAYEEGFEDMRRRVPDLAKIRGLISYEPATDLQQILWSLIEYYRKRLDKFA